MDDHRTEARLLRLLLVANGDPADPHTQSGVARHLMDALGERHEVVPASSAPSPAQRALIAATAWSPTRAVWQAQAHRGALATTVRTRAVARAAARAGPLDLALIVRNVYRPLGLPYVPYLDAAVVHTEEVAPDRVLWTGRRLDGVRARERAYLRGAAHVFTTGTDLARAVREGHGLAGSAVSVVGGGAHFPTEARVVPPAHPASILFVGNNFERKGGPDLLDAFALVRARRPDATLTIVGPGLDRVPDGVIALGRVRDRDAVQDLFRAAAVFAMPSRWEPFGLALLEAMSLSVPCVSTTVNAIPDIVEDGRTGLLVAPRTPRALADALLRLIEDPELARRLGDAGRHRVEDRMRWSHVAGRMGPILDRLASSRR